MDYSWTDEQLAPRNDTVEFSRNELADDVVARATEEIFFREGWRKCAAHGMHGLLYSVTSGVRRTIVAR